MLKLPFLDEKNAGKWEPSPGQFPVTICALRCLGVTVECSGLDTVWLEVDLYSSVTVMQILNGKHYKRAIECHMITSQALHDLWLEAFFKEYG